MRQGIADRDIPAPDRAHVVIEFILDDVEYRPGRRAADVDDAGYVIPERQPVDGFRRLADGHTGSILVGAPLCEVQFSVK